MVLERRIQLRVLGIRGVVDIADVNAGVGEQARIRLDVLARRRPRQVRGRARLTAQGDEALDLSLRNSKPIDGDNLSGCRAPVPP